MATSPRRVISPRMVTSLKGANVPRKVIFLRRRCLKGSTLHLGWTSSRGEMLGRQRVGPHGQRGVVCSLCKTPRARQRPKWFSTSKCLGYTGSTAGFTRRCNKRQRLSIGQEVHPVRRDPKILRRVSRILKKEGLHFANLFYIFE